MGTALVMCRTSFKTNRTIRCCLHSDAGEADKHFWTRNIFSTVQLAGDVPHRKINSTPTKTWKDPVAAMSLPLQSLDPE
jgi:hypothetical protein